MNILSKVMDYSFKEIADFMIAREDLADAFKNFNRNVCRETDTKLWATITAYEHEVPWRLREELGLIKGEDDLAARARLRLEQYNNACFAYDK